MAHHIGDFNVSSTGRRSATNSATGSRGCSRTPLHRRRMLLPQSPGVDPKTCIPELEKCVKEYGLRRHQPESLIRRRPLDQPAADRPPPVPDLREDGRVEIPAMIHVDLVQRLLPHHRRGTTSTPTTTASCSASRATCSRDFPDPVPDPVVAAARCSFHWGVSRPGSRR